MPLSAVGLRGRRHLSQTSAVCRSYEWPSSLGPSLAAGGAVPLARRTGEAGAAPAAFAARAVGEATLAEDGEAARAGEGARPGDAALRTGDAALAPAAADPHMRGAASNDIGLDDIGFDSCTVGK